MGSATGVHEARLAHEAALERLRTVQARWPDVRATVAPLKTLREANHFAEQLRAAFEARR